MQRLSFTNNRSTRTARKRRGTALAELAVCLPLITLVVFGGIETADMIFLKECLKSASYEGARAAAKFNSTNQIVYDRTNSVLDARHVTGATIEILLPDGHTDVSQLTRGERFQIRLSAPGSSNTAAPLRLFAGLDIVTSTYMVRE